MKMMKTAMLLIGALTLTGAAFAKPEARDAELKGLMVKLAELYKEFDQKYEPNWQARVEYQNKMYYGYSHDRKGWLKGFIGNFERGTGAAIVKKIPALQSKLTEVQNALRPIRQNQLGGAGERNGNLPLDAEYVKLRTPTGDWGESGSETYPNFQRAQKECARMKQEALAAIKSFGKEIQWKGGDSAQKIISDAFGYWIENDRHGSKQPYDAELINEFYSDKKGK